MYVVMLCPRSVGEYKGYRTNEVLRGNREDAKRAAENALKTLEKRRADAAKDGSVQKDTSPSGQEKKD